MVDSPNAWAVRIEMETPSENTYRRIHWAKRARITKGQRDMVAWTFKLARDRKIPDLPVTVKITRISKGTLDHDNLFGALKAVQDQIAKELGVDDADPRITWVHGQKIGTPPAVEIEISPRD